MKRFELFFDSLFEMLGNIIISFIRRVAPFAVPAAPAYFFGHAVATAVDTDAVAVYVGVVAAVGLESAGILAAHYAVKFYGSGEENRGHVATALAGLYLLIGIAAILLLDSTTYDAKAVGVAMFLIAGIVYLLTGLEVDTRTREQARAKAEQETAERLKADAEQKERERQALEAKEQERISWEREQAQIAQEAARQERAEERRLRHEERMAEIEAAKSTAQPSQAATFTAVATSHYECSCGRVFDKPQSYSAHTRHCTIYQRMGANGHT